MPLTNAGRDLITSAIKGDSYTAYTSVNAHLYVGNSSAAFAAAQTDMQGANKTRGLMDAGYPTISTNVLVFRATFSTASANHQWEEWGVINGSSGGTLLNRVVESLGTKTSAQSWQFTATITVSAA